MSASALSVLKVHGIHFIPTLLPKRKVFSMEKNLRRVLKVVFSHFVGELRPDNSQGDAADGAQRGGATVLGLQASQEDTEVRIQGRRTCKHPPPQKYPLNL